MNERDATLERLEDQIAWYDQKSVWNQRLFKIAKAVQIIAAAAIPVIVLMTKYKWPQAALGALIVVLEGFQQLNQDQQNWIAYRSTCEALRHEKFLFLAEAGPYAAAAEPRTLLAERIEGLVSQEHAKWVSAREEPSTPKP